MINPWTKKNPFMSMWLSGANSMAGKARSAGAAQAGRQQTQLLNQATRFWTDAWFGTTEPKPTPKPETQTKTPSKTKRKTR